MELARDDGRRGPRKSSIDAVFTGNMAEEWMAKGECTDPAYSRVDFFPPPYSSFRQLRQICSVCEVRQECYEFAMEHNQSYGVWGGLSGSERKKRRGKWLAGNKTLPPVKGIINQSDARGKR